MIKFRFLRKCLKWALALALLILLLILCLNLWINFASGPYMYSNLDHLPKNQVGLVLGTSQRTRSGRLNLHFKSRMDAAALLFKEGKIKHILASGDNQYATYNEPKAMKEALIQRGVPEEAITLDYAGLRTLDSIVRAKEIFGQDKFTIISQEYHNSRAVFIARYYGMDAIAFCAQKVEIKHSLKTELREYLAKVKAVIDLYITKQEPRHLGKKEPIVLRNE